MFGLTPGETIMKNSLKSAALAFIFAGMVAVGLLVGTADLVHAQAARTELEFGLNRTAKVLCSAVFVSGRDLD